VSHHRNGQLKTTTKTAFLLAAVALLIATPAHAFGWGYSPLTGSTTRMWLSRSLYNPYNLIRGGYSAPYYLANTLGWNAAYAVGQGFNAGKKNSRAINQMQMFGQPGVVDQIAPAQWAAAKQNQAQAPFHAPDLASSAPALLAPEADPFFMPVPMSIDGNSSSTQSAPINPTQASAIPAAAPDFRNSKEQKHKQKKQKKQKKQDAESTLLANNQSPPQQVQSPLKDGPVAESANDTNLVAPSFAQNQANGSATATEAGKMPALPGSKQPIATATAAASANPFAQAFVEHVNGKFGSDINKAFSDKETCGYAQAMGLIDDKNKAITIQPDRVELIRQILQDPAEDSLTKVNTIRMLIKH
jgi:hypothetical protein